MLLKIFIIIHFCFFAFSETFSLFVAFMSLFCYFLHTTDSHAISMLPFFSRFGFCLCTITTVKVTPKKGKATNLKATITVKNPTLTVTAANTVIAVGTKETVKATTKPTTKVTFKSSDDSIATVDAATGEVTGVKAGKVTITATAGKLTKTVDMEVKTAILKSVKQSESDAVVATIEGDTAAIKPADVKITNTATKATVPVKAVSVSKTDKTQVTITTFTGMTDAKEYAVNYAGVDATFTATNGTVASVGITKANVPAGIETEVKMVTKDANGVVLGYTALDAGSSNKGSVSAETTVSNGYINGTKVYLPSVGNTMTVKVTYHTGTFGTDGSETGNISDTFTITAVDPSAVNLTFSLTIDGVKTTPYWNATSFKANSNVPVNVSKFLHVRALDDENAEQSVAGYTAESADKSKVLVTEGRALDDTTDGIEIKGVSEGATYVLIKKDGKTVATLPVTVVAAPVATTLSLSQTSVTVVTGSAIDETVALTVKDQYGDAMDMSAATTDVTIVGKVKDTALTDATVKTYMTDNKTFVVSGAAFSADEKEAGTTTLKFSTKLGDKTVTAALAVKLVKADGTATYKLRFDNAAVDTTVTAAAHDAQTINASVVEMVNGGAKTYAAISGGAISYVVKNAKGEVVAQISNNTDTKTCAAISGYTSNFESSNNSLKIEASTESSNNFAKNLVAGTYTVTATFTPATGAAGAGKETSVTGTFTVADTQDTLASIVIVSDNFDSKKIDAALQDTDLVKVYYDGVPQTISTVKDIDAIELSNGGAYLKSVTVMVKVTGTSYNVPVTICVNRTIAKCAGIK